MFLSFLSIHRRLILAVLAFVALVVSAGLAWQTWEKAAMVTAQLRQLTEQHTQAQTLADRFAATGRITAARMVLLITHLQLPLMPAQQVRQ